MAKKTWLRYFKLTVQMASGSESAIDLSDFRVKFHVTQAITGRPSTAEITVYNVSDETSNRIEVPANAAVNDRQLRVILEAGYQSNHGVIFQGDLWWKSSGRESETETFMRLIASTGDRAYQYGVVNQSFPAGATQGDELEAVIKAMTEKGIGSAGTPALAKEALPRGKVMYGMARDALQDVADANGLLYAYTDRGIRFSPKQGEDKAESGRVIVLNAASGLLDRPVLTVNGVQVKALLNPELEVGRIIQIDQSSLQNQDWSTAYAEMNYAATEQMMNADGLYTVYSREFTGDTRGDDWYSDLVCTAYNNELGAITPNFTQCLPNQ